VFADDYPVARDAALHFLDMLTTKPTHANILRFLARVRPKSRLLLECCLSILHREPDRVPRHHDEAIVAAELLGEHFGGDQEVLLQLISGWTVDFPRRGVILALCEGWPESPLLDEIMEAWQDQRLELSHVAFFQLLSRKAQQTSTAAQAAPLSGAAASHTQTSDQTLLDPLSTAPTTRASIGAFPAQ
jgi:hypothetical protein